MDGGELIIFCLFRKFIVIRANRDYKCSAVNFPFSHEPWCPSYFFTAYSRFIFILFRFVFLLFVPPWLASSRLVVDFLAVKDFFSVGRDLNEFSITDCRWCNRRLRPKERL